MEKETGTCLKIKCNTREAEFYLQKYRKVGKTISNCIKYNSRWISPPEFEKQILSLKADQLGNGLQNTIWSLAHKDRTVLKP